MIVAEFQGRLIAMTNQADLVDVGRIVIVYELGHEIVVSRCFRIEFKADDAEALTLDQTD